MSLRVKCNLRDDGCQWEGELRELDKHLEKCSRERIPCPYAALGCKAEFLKKKLDEHNAATDHLAMAVKKISLLTDRLDRVEGERRLPPVVFKMKYIDFRKENEIVWNSPPFYTHPRGYKLYLKVSFETNECDYFEGEDLYTISIHVCLMHGEYDEDLPWPFRGVVDFEVLNQDEDFDHKEGEARFLERRTSLKNKRVTAAEGRNDTGWGVEKIMGLDDDEPDLTQYLQQDTIYIRVSQVSVSDRNKPWLIY